MTVEITATISINKDGTWHILNFGNTKQETIDSFWTDTLEERKAKEEEEHVQSEFKPASWYLDNAKKTRKRKKIYNRGPNHCGICGMKNKNKLTCLSIIDINGKLVNGEQRHRAPVSYTRGWE
jgi:hypothetical protein